MAAGAAAGIDGAWASTYYVAPTGSDSNAGSSAAPFLTLQAGVDAAAAGDTIVVRDGTYGPTGGTDSMAVTIAKAGTSGAWITLQAEHDGAAVLDCRLTCHSYINLAGGSAYWIIRGFDIRGGRWAGIFANSSGAKNVVVRNNLIHHIGNRADSSDVGIMGIYTDAGASNWKIDGNVIHDIGRTSVLTGTHDHGIYTHGSAMTITNNVFYNAKNGWHIQTADGFSGTIANNTFYGPDPVASNEGQIMLWGADSNVIIRNNIFDGSNAAGITTYALTMSGACSIDHNLAYTAGASVSVIGSAPSGCAQSSEQLNVDPKLASPSSYDFHLNAGSPAIDAGAAVPGLTADLDGRPRPQGTALDIGAFEYGGAVPAPTPTPTPTPAPAPSSSCTTGGGGAWANASLASQTGSFTLQLDATPSAANLDGVIGVSNGNATGYSSLAAIIRFNGSGTIDARNAGVYSAAASIPYSAGATYHLRLEINVASRTYSAYATPPGGAERLIGSNYAFRSEQASATALNNLGLYAAAGTETACNVAVAVPAPTPAPTPAPPPAPTPAPTPAPSGCTVGAGGSWANASFAKQTGSFTLQFDATPSAANLDGVIGASNGSATGYSSLAAAVRFNGSGAIDARTGGAYAAAASIPYSANAPYHFRLAISVPSRTYSAYVTPPGGAERLIGSGYAFRSEQAGAAALNNLGLYAAAGGQTVCGVAVTGAAPAAAPVISAVAAANVTGSGATISWTTDTPSDSTVEYGATSAYGASSPMSAALTTSHSVTLSGLAGATTYHYRVKSKDASGALATSPDAMFATTTPAPVPAPASCASAAAGLWKNEAAGLLTGSVTVQFDAKPGMAGMDGVIGLSNGNAAAYTALAAAVRFNNAGKIDARNDGSYAAAASIPYSAGQSYHFRLAINVSAHNYSAYVTPPGGSEQLIGSSYAFRSEQTSASALSNVALYATTGNLTICSLTAAGAAVPLK